MDADEALDKTDKITKEVNSVTSMKTFIIFNKYLNDLKTDTKSILNAGNDGDRKIFYQTLIDAINNHFTERKIKEFKDANNSVTYTYIFEDKPEQTLTQTVEEAVKSLIKEILTQLEICMNGVSGTNPLPYGTNPPEPEPEVLHIVKCGIPEVPTARKGGGTTPKKTAKRRQRKRKSNSRKRKMKRTRRRH